MARKNLYLLYRIIHGMMSLNILKDSEESTFISNLHLQLIKCKTKEKKGKKKKKHGLEVLMAREICHYKTVYDNLETQVENTPFSSLCYGIMDK